MKEKYNWNLEDIFKTNEEFQENVSNLQEILNKVKKYQGSLNTSDKIYECYYLYEEALKLYEKIYAYGMLKYHLNMGESENIKLYKKVQNIGTDFERLTAFITPEVTNIDEKILVKFINENKKLSRYERLLKEIIEHKKHILSKEEETLLANYSEVFSSMKNTFDILTNTEFKFGKIIFDNEIEKEMTDSTYTKYLKDKNRNVRKQAFNLMYDKYSEFLNTITELYLSRVKESVITAKIRKYKSSLDMAVFNDDSTMKVYNALIEAVHNNLKVNHKFIKLKKELLKQKEMHLYDIYVNPIEIKDEEIKFEEAKTEVINSLSVLGKNYIEKIKEAFDNSWIDAYEKPNKIGGAYSMGVYGIHPYVLTNFIYNKRDISTIAHELGHAMHSYYSNSNQNILDSNYTIMVAEIASTTNEILLAKYQIEHEKDKNKKAEIIYELLEMIRATLFRQAMFAEFEEKVHSKIEKGDILSSEELNKIYYKLNEEYFGQDVIIDEQIKYEWARIPHFYRPFYVYKYATGISAAIVIASNILKKKEGYVDKYIDMLSRGCTKKSIDLLKLVDVDLEDIKTYEGAIDFYKELIEELNNLLI